MNVKSTGQCLFLVVCWMAGAGDAEEMLPDPTRPPAAVLAPEPASAESGKAAEVVPVLRAVVLSPQRKAAAINGRAVRLGEKFGDYRLVGLNPGEAELRQKNGQKQTLKLLGPSVQKTVTVPAPARPMSRLGADKTKE